jgi:hypothetical protein
MDKEQISRKLDAIVVSRLFGNGSWLADRETSLALQRILLQMKLEEQIPGENSTYRSTALGLELNIDLLMVFMGLWCEWEIPYLLEKNGLLDESQCGAILDRLGRGRDPERLLRRHVQQAYIDYYKLSKTRH